MLGSIFEWFSGWFWEPFSAAFLVNNRWLSYFQGVQNTLIISLFAVLLGVAIGLIIAVVKYFTVRNKKRFIFRILDFICNTYVTIIRSTPVMLQLLIIYNLIFTSRNTSPLISAIVCFGINSGAYVSEIIRAGIESIDKGQMEAGLSLGLKSSQGMRLIVLPQAIKNILPALGNEFIVLVKETSIAGIIAVTEVLKAAQNIGNRTYDILPPLFIAAGFYLVIILCLTKLLRTFERRLARGDRK